LGVIQKGIAPHQLFGAVGQELTASLRHDGDPAVGGFARDDPSQGELLGPGGASSRSDRQQRNVRDLGVSAASSWFGDWRHGVDPAVVEEKLTADRAHRLKAVCVVHNETSTGVASRIPEIREAIDRARHPALLMVDTISSLASIDYRHDAWKVDVTVAGSQKGLMLPPGLGFNAVSKKALAMSKTARLPRSYWDWEAMLDTGRTGFFPYTPATNLLFGLRESLRMLLDEEGLPAVFRRHARHAEATRRAAAGWGLEVLCADPREHSNSLTAILVPAGFDADRLREIILEAFDMSLGTGLGKLKGKVFRIGHLGHFNDLMLCGTLAGVEIGLHRAGIPHHAGGVMAAIEFLGSISSDLATTT
jgi:alanine-glyoxylate transaminase/serine-glyoxylate transaminase/serine-pyruvate transaminase